MNRKQRRAGAKNSGPAAPSLQDLHALAAAFNEGRLIEAERLARHATRRFPGHAFAWKVLGAALVQQGRQAEALAPLEKAVSLMPGDAEAHYNLGVNLRQLEQFAAAAACCVTALNLDPRSVVALNNLGTNLHDLGQTEAAIACYQRTLALAPDYADAYGNLGVDLVVLGRPAEACFQRRLVLVPDDEAARHHLASLAGQQTERAPAAYVEQVFDGYAHHFDRHLQQGLGYAVPQALVDLLRPHAPPASGGWTVLDLGCGTGLVGRAIAGEARSLVGVDLSAKMLQKAKEGNLYHRLVRQDLTQMMQAEPNATYDVIIAADVFIYLGKLDGIFVEVRRLLRPGGVFAFSIEGGSGEAAYRLDTTGRYVHSADYVRSLAADQRLSVVQSVPTVLRRERNAPVGGILMVTSGRSAD